MITILLRFLICCFLCVCAHFFREEDEHVLQYPRSGEVRHPSPGRPVAQNASLLAPSLDGTSGGEPCGGPSLNHRHVKTSTKRVYCLQLSHLSLCIIMS